MEKSNLRNRWRSKLTIKTSTWVTALLLLFVCVGCESAEQKAKRQQQEQAIRVAKEIWQT